MQMHLIMIAKQVRLTCDCEQLIQLEAGVYLRNK